MKPLDYIRLAGVAFRNHDGWAATQFLDAAHDGVVRPDMEPYLAWDEGDLNDLPAISQGTLAAWEELTDELCAGQEGGKPAYWLARTGDWHETDWQRARTVFLGRAGNTTGAYAYDHDKVAAQAFYEGALT